MECMGERACRTPGQEKPQNQHVRIHMKEWKGGYSRLEGTIWVG